MNAKKILAGVLSSAMLMSMTSAVMAEETDLSIMPVNEAEIMPISVEENTYDKTIMTGTVKEIFEGQIIFGEDEFAINVDESTVILDENGDVITIDDIKAEDIMMIVASTMQTRSVPPQSYGYLLAKADGDILPTFIEVAEISEDENKNTFLLSADGQYRVVISSKTEGEALDTIKEGTQVLVYSKIMTMSIPAMIPAEKAIVLEDNTVPTIEAEAEEITVLDKVRVNGTEIALEIRSNNELTGLEGKFLPVRAISEALGYEVKWDGDLKAITIGTTPMGINFNIDVNLYNKARMMPRELSGAPVILKDLTYVPQEFFSELLGAEVTIVDGQININLAQAE